MVNSTLISRLTAVTHGPLSFGPDRRAHTRVSFDCPVRWGGEGEERIGWARDASECGAGFIVPAHGAPEVGERIRLIYRLDNYCDWLIDRKAKVLWSEPTDGGLCQVGVQFASQRRQMD
jgi:hypothetical protein